MPPDEVVVKQTKLVCNGNVVQQRWEMFKFFNSLNLSSYPDILKKLS